MAPAEQREAEGQTRGADEPVRQRIEQPVQAAADEPRERKKTDDEEGRERIQSSRLFHKKLRFIA